MYERKDHKLISIKDFQKRVIGNILWAIGILLASLLIGILGYHYLGGLDLIDSIYNASMILGGMGPANELTGSAAKLFASIYALYSGIAIISTVAVILAPVLHRMMHKFHLKED